MRPSIVVALFGLVYIVTSFIAFVKDDQMLGYFFMGAAVLNSAASFICLAIEKFGRES